MIGTILSGWEMGKRCARVSIICGVKGWLRVLGKRVWRFIMGNGVFAVQGLPLLSLVGSTISNFWRSSCGGWNGLRVVIFDILDIVGGFGARGELG